MNRQREIELNIDELVLHGFPPGERYAIADAVEQTLSQLLTEQIANEGIPDSLANNSRRAHVDGGSFNVETGAKSGAIGGQIAQNIHQGLTK
jgi:hypothetical protein